MPPPVVKTNMARQKRLDIPGGIYHVLTRGIDRMTIFRDNADYQHFLDRLEAVLRKTQCRCYAWVLMHNHLHLLLRTMRRALCETMSGLLTGYALYFNRKYHRKGYLFQNLYQSILCQEEPYFI